MAPKEGLSERSVAVLQMIADGWSYSQIVDGHPDLSYFDIFSAAQEALDLNDALDHSEPRIDQRMAELKSGFPQAYERWTREEEERLVSMYRDGKALKVIAEGLGRRPSALRSRLLRLGILPQAEAD